MTSFIPMCLGCKYYDGWSNPAAKDEKKRRICKAFPDGIPSDVLMMDFIHTERHPDQDNDIVYEAE